MQLMLDTGLPCFRGQTIELLRQRLQPQGRDGHFGSFFLHIFY